MHSTDYPVRRLCQTLKVHPSSYYTWLAEPQSARAKEDQRLLGLIKHAWLESGGVYGYRMMHDDLRELGETCGRNRVGRLMQAEVLRSQTGYRRRPGFFWQKANSGISTTLPGSTRSLRRKPPRQRRSRKLFQLFQLLKRERIRRKIYGTRDKARCNIFDYIEMLYNPQRRHSSAMQLSPVEYEKRYFLSLESV
ncbi:transposase InsO family protein [Pseudomonas sp. Y3 TE3536]